MKPLRFLWTVLLFTVTTSAWAASPAVEDLMLRVEALEGQVTTLQAQVTQLTQDLATERQNRMNADADETFVRETGDQDLQTAINTLEVSLGSLLDLAPYVGVDPNPRNGLTGPHVIFLGVNVHVLSGAGSTDDGCGSPCDPSTHPLSGLGNLIIGYDETRFAASAKTGSHNLVIGPEHNYTNFGGLVAGKHNTISGSDASVSGGESNTASGQGASVSGGEVNTASGEQSSVSGGVLNRASAHGASVSGGASNIASGPAASVSGGEVNTASGQESSVSGGTNCEQMRPFGWSVGDTSVVSAGCDTSLRNP